MCGIVGFTGRRQASPILLEGLSRLEYRGYDSAGLAVRDGAGDVEIVKAKGRLRVLSEKTMRFDVERLLRYRSHPLGDPRRTVRAERASALQLGE